MATLTRRVPRALLQTSPAQLRGYASPSGFKRKTGIRDGDGAPDAPGEQPTGRRRRDTVRPTSPLSHLAHNRFLGFSSDANFPADPPAFSTRPPQSTHTPALPSSKQFAPLLSSHLLTFSLLLCVLVRFVYSISLGNNHTCSRLTSTQIPSQ